MTSLILTLVLLAQPACWADGHNHHRDKQAIVLFKKRNPCPEKCATFVKENGKYVLYKKCGRCQVDHICPLACCGADKPENMQWLTAEENNAKGADCSACRK